MKEEKIDFVVTWLDTHDIKWQESYHKYRGGEHKEDNGRYRNWDLFKYWFRAVENYAPWVNKIFLVTNGKNPDWINPSNPKLVLIKHSDYMPIAFLPTFNSRAIELNFYRIKELSEHFVYFNDDMFINAPVTPSYYFKKGLPCDCNEETLFYGPSYDPINKFSTKISIYCDMALLNYHFNRAEVVNRHIKNWYGLHLGWRGIFTSFLLRNRNKFEYFRGRHFEQPMLKSIIQDIWNKEEEMAEKSCTQFRQDVSLNPYIIRYWQFATNNFYPVKNNSGKNLTMGLSDIKVIRKVILGDRYKSLCLNDTPYCSHEDYLIIKKNIHEAYEIKLPKKSSFEL